MFSPTSVNMIRQNLRQNLSLSVKFLIGFLFAMFLYKGFVYPLQFNPTFNSDRYDSVEDFFQKRMILLQQELEDSRTVPEEAEFLRNKIRLWNHEWNQYGKETDSLYSWLFVYDEVWNHTGWLFYLVLLWLLLELKTEPEDIQTRTEGTRFIKDRLTVGLFFTMLFWMADLIFAFAFALFLEGQIATVNFRMFDPVPVVMGDQIRTLPVWLYLALTEAGTFLHLAVLAAFFVYIHSHRWRVTLVVTGLSALAPYPLMTDKLRDFFFIDHGTVSPAGWGVLVPVIYFGMFLAGAWFLMLRMIKKQSQGAPPGEERADSA